MLLTKNKIMFKRVKKFWRDLHPNCQKCKDGKIWLLGNEPNGMNVYECDECKTWYI